MFLKFERKSRYFFFILKSKSFQFFCKATPYGVIKAAWKIADGEMTMTVAVPVGTECTVVLPSGEEKVLGSGEYTVTAKA